MKEAKEKIRKPKPALTDESKRFKSIRKGENLTQEETGEVLNVSQPMIVYLKQN